ncbi:MAG: GFA family protein [Pseudomonadota bacterium]
MANEGIEGGCLCGAIRYEVTGAPAMAAVCHCRNCQKQAGSAFSTLIGVGKTQFEIRSGEPKLYTDQDTTSGAPVGRYFCGDCGSPIYSAVPAQPETIFIKSGTLDDTSDFAPQLHFWCSTKQPWVTLGDGVPTLDQQG